MSRNKGLYQEPSALANKSVAESHANFRARKEKGEYSEREKHIINTNRQSRKSGNALLRALNKKGK